MRREHISGLYVAHGWLYLFVKRSINIVYQIQHRPLWKGLYRNPDLASASSLDTFRLY